MTATEEYKRTKKFAVGELPPSPSTSTGMTVNTKRASRHHVKRRSSGRVHVSKLAPMARAYGNNDSDHNEDKKPMKRSQSNKSLQKLPTSERKLALNTLTAVTVESQLPDCVKELQTPHSPPTTPPSKSIDEKRRPLTQDKIPAPPIEQTLNATADDITVDKAALDTKMRKKSYLRSQFVEKSGIKMNNVASAATQSAGMTRTQQKLLLQREQTLVLDENSISHPKNMLRLTREMEKMRKEYRCVRRYQDPMMDSLVRCQMSKDEAKHNDLPRKAFLNAHQRTFSSSILPTHSDTAEHTPHMEHRRQILLRTAMQQQHQQPQDNRWIASTLLDRLFKS
ncbi:hypothetical protein BDB01DRAFT_779458 [Pilobolus umbonatus]|nr:hypothetical protein BDB01DRAFT_779458 [Pilobolus umbonatus]